ncbi:hypothetical protein, unlikely [Trypanosoma brucei brucei TREU927]|uniref:Uncharacterized protein n=1 Tax=Trypanosoma brucei brucei (strain 927/4 GUTat10.1) TaxID=185431 RepID=Q4GYF8_TRYB2|nr:hypothetical protein, unlikely [Trypanosoma brucei brucei TREU927]CAJ16626.1 hypothetical protein, unlikely [Trypanosoma brucei brucei TREU927]
MECFRNLAVSAEAAAGLWELPDTFFFSFLFFFFLRYFLFLLVFSFVPLNICIL